MAEKPKWNPSRLLVLPVKRCYVLISHRSNLSYQCFYAPLVMSCSSPPALASALPSPATSQFGWSQESKVAVDVDVSSGSQWHGERLRAPWWRYSRQWTNIPPLLLWWDNRAKVRGCREPLGNVERCTLLWEHRPTLGRIWGKQFCKATCNYYVLGSFFFFFFWMRGKLSTCNLGFFFASWLLRLERSASNILLLSLLSLLLAVGYIR